MRRGASALQPDRILEKEYRFVLMLESTHDAQNVRTRLLVHADTFILDTPMRNGPHDPVVPSAVHRAQMRNVDNVTCEPKLGLSSTKHPRYVDIAYVRVRHRILSPPAVLTAFVSTLR